MLIDINSFRSPLYTLEYKRQNVVKPGHLFGGGVAVVINDKNYFKICCTPSYLSFRGVTIIKLFIN
jgi:hypothetical protein